QVLTGVTLTLEGGTVTGGLAPHGGALLNQGATDVVDTVFTANTATGTGGALRNSATATRLSLLRTTVTDNEAGSGGGVITFADALIADSTIADNHSANAAGGLRVMAGGSVLVSG